MGLIVDQVNQLTRGGWDLIRDKEEVCTRAATSQQVQEVQRNKRYKRHKRSNKTRGAIRQEVQQDKRCNEMATARPVSSLKKTSTTRQKSLSMFSNTKEDGNEISALRQSFEDVKNDNEALKKLAYEMVETALLGRHAKTDVRDVIDEFEHGRVLGVVDNNTNRLIKKWAQKGLKHFVKTLSWQIFWTSGVMPTSKRNE